MSWSVFGAKYPLSGNLRLVVVAHAATDYGVTPHITNEPAFGLAFMATLVAGAWWQGSADGRRRAHCEANTNRTSARPTG